MASKSRDRHLEIIDAALLGARLVKDAAEVAPVLAPLKGTVGIVITILETIRGVTTNKKDWATLSERLSTQTNGVQDNLSRCPTPHSTQLLFAVNSYEQKLRNVLTRVRLATRGPIEGTLRQRTDKEEIAELNRDVEIYWEDFIREISVQTHETVHRIEKRTGRIDSSVNRVETGVSNVERGIGRVEKDVNRMKNGVMRVEMSMEALGDNNSIKDLMPLLSATGEEHDICLHGTRTTVLAPIHQWVNDLDAPQLWWLTDVAGAGKSTIAKQLSMEWKREGRLGGCFFFDKNRPEATNKQGFCDTLGAQLANNQPQLRLIITQGIKEIGPILSVCPFEEKLQKLVIQPMKSVALVLVIDALDECNERDRAIILRNLLSSLSQAPQLKIFIASRPEHDIARFLDPYRSHTESLHDIDLKSNRDDIAAFVKHKMRNLLHSSELMEKEVNQLAKRVSCLFILASTACKVVQDSPDPQATLHELLNPKQSPLRDVNSLYLTILTKACKNDQIEEESALRGQELLVKVLKVILAATIPLTIATIDTLLGIKNTRRLIGLLSSVLNVRDDGTVLILHPTFREFLEVKAVAGQFHIDMAEAHRLMAKRCLAIMKQGLCFNICQLKTSFVLNNKVQDMKERISKYISKELQYGCVYWPDHIVQGNVTFHDREVEVSVLQITENGYPLFWMEIISALEKVPKGIKDLQAVERCHFEKGLKARMNDIKRFLIAFSIPISQSIPHIYVSALPFTPKLSYVRRIADVQFPNVMSVSIGSMEKWPEPPRRWTGHTGSVTSIAFSPDGYCIASGSTDKTIRLWDAETGQILGEPLRGHNSTIFSVAFSPDGRQIASGSWDETIRLWDAETGQTVGEPLRGHSSRVMSVAFSPDGHQLVSGSCDMTIRLWDTETGQMIGEPLRGHSREIRSVAFSPDGHRLVSGSDDKTIQMWDVESGQAIGEPLQGHSKPISSVTFSPDGCFIASGSEDKTIRIWNAITGQAVGEPLQAHNDKVRSVAFAPDGRRIASCSYDKTIQLWDAETGQALGEPLQGQARIRSIAFSPDSRWVASGDLNNTIQLWDAETTQAIGESLQGHISAVVSVKFSPDGRQILSGSQDKTIWQWDAETGQALTELRQGDNNNGGPVAFSPDGLRIAYGLSDKTVQLWDVEASRAIGEPLQGHSKPISSVTFSPDGCRIASVSGDYTIQIWDAETGRALGEPLRGHIASIRSVAFSPDGCRVVSGSWDLTIQLWDVETSQALREPLRGHTRAIDSVVFSPDGRRIASGSYDKTIRLWDIKTGQELIQPLHGHSRTIFSITFSPDGRRIISGSEDKTIRLWDVETGKALGEPLKGHTGAVRSVAVSPDGCRIVSGSDDNTIRLWVVEPDRAFGDTLHAYSDLTSSVSLSSDSPQLISDSLKKTIQPQRSESSQTLDSPTRNDTRHVTSAAHLPIRLSAALIPHQILSIPRNLTLSVHLVGLFNQCRRPLLTHLKYRHLAHISHLQAFFTALFHETDGCPLQADYYTGLLLITVMDYSILTFLPSRQRAQHAPRG
ncbi:POC1 centriolar protein A [Serendipita sp. 400]|nr:POC1 centriolar protein A [Serendipita sp. 400]